MPGHNSPHAKRRHVRVVLPNWATYAFLALFVVGVVALGYFTYNTIKKFIITAPWGDPASPEFGTAQAATAEAGSIAEAIPDAWDEGRVTVLVMGIDERSDEDGPWRTDTMILVTVDPATKTAGMLSIPRDLWVEIPDYGGVYDRINTAHFRGDADHYPGGGGPVLAMKTVQYNFGVEINYYLTINFNAFVMMVDYLGCVPIDVAETIDDPDYPAARGYGYDPFHIDAGNHCLDGTTLLKYARTRATYGGDFDRAARQQQVIHAIRDEVMNSGQLLSLISRSPEIWETLAGGINTNLTLQQMTELAMLAQEIPDESICSAVINGEYINPTTLSDGSQVLIPNHDLIRGLVLDIYAGTGHCAPGVQDLAAAVAQERASVNILNGTLIEGLATETGDLLSAMGINVISVGNADRFDYDNTIIYNYTGKVNTARYLAQLLQVPETAIVETETTGGLYDIQIILGDDYRP